MPSISKEVVVRTYERLVSENDGKVIGERVFLRETGYSHHLWKGQYWRSWSDFQEAAGFSPNKATDKTPDDVLLRSFAELALEIGRIPTEPDLMIKRNNDQSFPSKAPFRRWGNRSALLDAVAVFCREKAGFSLVLSMLREGTSKSVEQRLIKNVVKEFVYLLRSGKSYKIGRSTDTGRRLSQLAIQLPNKPDTVHVIETDDPEGIELYWHRRFAEKRQQGEWFQLTSDDIEAFKRRQYQ
jgi:hypothetical protein